jgi:hypothetical protein
MTSCVTGHNTAKVIYSFEARGMPKRFSQPANFGGIDALQPGEKMRFSLCIR